MKIKIESTFDADLDFIWQKLILSATLEFIAHPPVKFEAIEPSHLPTIWQIGKYETVLKIFNLIPFGRHFIVIEIPESNNSITKTLIDNGYGAIISRWYHVINIKKINEKQTQYIDKVEVKAGILTPFIWLFAYTFYSWRQYRWKKLIS
ncbi:MAG: hypothetical protein MUF43_08550 [Flavobacterium sp.]|jgi:hypothetical protein|nr:hypothetical protein [Flavobacterium sp.]